MQPVLTPISTKIKHEQNIQLPDPFVIGLGMTGGPQGLEPGPANLHTTF